MHASSTRGDARPRNNGYRRQTGRRYIPPLHIAPVTAPQEILPLSSARHFRIQGRESRCFKSEGEQRGSHLASLSFLSQPTHTVFRGNNGAACESVLGPSVVREPAKRVAAPNGPRKKNKPLRPREEGCANALPVRADRATGIKKDTGITRAAHAEKDPRGRRTPESQAPRMLNTTSEPEEKQKKKKKERKVREHHVTHSIVFVFARAAEEGCVEIVDLLRAVTTSSPSQKQQYYGRRGGDRLLHA